MLRLLNVVWSFKKGKLTYLSVCHTVLSYCFIWIFMYFKMQIKIKNVFLIVLLWNKKILNNIAMETLFPSLISIRKVWIRFKIADFVTVGGESNRKITILPICVSLSSLFSVKFAFFKLFEITSQRKNCSNWLCHWTTSVSIRIINIIKINDIILFLNIPEWNWCTTMLACTHPGEVQALKLKPVCLSRELAYSWNQLRSM